MFNLQPLAFLLGQTLVVGYLLDKKANLLAEVILKLLWRGLCVLNGVVQNRSLEGVQVGYSANAT